MLVQKTHRITKTSDFSLTKVRRHRLREDDNGQPSGDGVLETIHAADDERALFVVGGADLVGPGVAKTRRRIDVRNLCYSVESVVLFGNAPGFWS
jgi:hypothetical protein